MERSVPYWQQRTAHSDNNEQQRRVCSDSEQLLWVTRVKKLCASLIGTGAIYVLLRGGCLNRPCDRHSRSSLASREPPFWWNDFGTLEPRGTNRLRARNNANMPLSSELSITQQRNIDAGHHTHAHLLRLRAGPQNRFYTLANIQVRPNGAATPCRSGFLRATEHIARLFISVKIAASALDAAPYIAPFNIARSGWNIS